MNDPTPPGRSKLFGRLVVIGLGLLVLVYVIPMVLSLIPAAS